MQRSVVVNKNLEESEESLIQAVHENSDKGGYDGGSASGLVAFARMPCTGAEGSFTFYHTQQLDGVQPVQVERHGFLGGSPL